MYYVLKEFCCKEKEKSGIVRGEYGSNFHRREK